MNNDLKKDENEVKTGAEDYRKDAKVTGEKVIDKMADGFKKGTYAAGDGIETVGKKLQEKGLNKVGSKIEEFGDKIEHLGD